MVSFNGDSMSQHVYNACMFHLMQYKLCFLNVAIVLSLEEVTPKYKVAQVGNSDSHYNI
jgi:hypothetical protein